MAGQRQSQSGFGNQYPSGQMRRMPNYGQGRQTPTTDFCKDKKEEEYAQACSHVSQQLRAQIGDQRPAWDGPIPGFWDNLPPPAGPQQQQQQSHAMNQQQNQLRRPATNFEQDRLQQQQQQQQQYMGGDNEASHFHAQEHVRASQLHKGGSGSGSGSGSGGGGGGGGVHGGVNPGILPSTGMQQAPGQYNGQPYQNTTNHQGTTSLPGPSPNLFAPRPPGTGIFGQQVRNQPGYAPSPSNAQLYPSRTNRGGNNNNKNSLNGYNAP